MKELSIEQKAQRYDEALERARKFATDLPNGRNDRLYHVWDLESIFPELKESEDAMIIRELTSLFKDGIKGINHQYTGEDCERWVAWLEKQGEHKPVNWLQELEDKLANATPKQLAEWKEKYFKEEPAEWSEEEKKRIDRIIDVLDWAEDKGRISYRDWEDYVTYVRCLRQQPNTKWYKLDDNIQKKIINYFECQREIEPTRKDILNTWIDWLKSLSNK